eukprot:jgi/Psemu1/294763/fgenesh1_pm.30_\
MLEGDENEQEIGFSSFGMQLCDAKVTGTTGPTLVVADEACAAGDGECANPDVAATDVDISADAAEAEADAPEAIPIAAAKEPLDPNCPSRDVIIRCAGKYLDTNENGKLDRPELQGAIDQLPWYARGILQILGSVDKMMKKCDMDGDDAISMDYDMIHNKDQCLASCFKRKAFRNSFFPDCE